MSLVHMGPVARVSQACSESGALGRPLPGPVLAVSAASVKGSVEQAEGRSPASSWLKPSSFSLPTQEWGETH